MSNRQFALLGHCTAPVTSKNLDGGETRPFLKQREGVVGKDLSCRELAVLYWACSVVCAVDDLYLL
jgi:hypothetical protein